PRGAGPPGVRPVGRPRVLGPDQPPGLARLGADPARPQVAGVFAGAVFGQRGVAPRFRPVDRGPGRRSVPVGSAMRTTFRAGPSTEDGPHGGPYGGTSPGSNA